MKKILLLAIAGIIVGAVVGCAPSAEGDTSKPAPAPANPSTSDPAAPVVK